MITVAGLAFGEFTRLSRVCNTLLSLLIHWWLISIVDYNMPLTIYGVAYSINKVPRMAEVAHAEGWEMGSHGCR
jgi:hypothetical protein